MKKLLPLIAIPAILLSACASSPPVETYTGALVSQQVSFDTNICRYDTGLTIYTQGNCPPSVRTNVFTR